MARGPSIVVGLDFGTTFSGIAWAFEGSVDELEVISAWPGGGNRTSVKVPSVISYDGQRTYWGYQVRPFTEAFRGVKLLLDENQETKYTPSLASKALLVKHKTNAVQVMADYLKYLVEYAKSVLQRRFGIPAKDMDLRFTLTVPAVWSDTAKDRTMNAAIKANIRPQDVTLVSEPEAAALYTLRSIQGNSISKNDVFIVCDAGGGTVDLISYQIKTLEPLVLVEVTEGTGRICGSMLLDQRFEELLRDRMGVNFATLPSKSKEAALSYWQDRVKPNYTGKLDNDYVDIDYFIPLPGVADDLTIPIEDGFFQLSSDDVEDIFEPIIHDVEDLIAEQVASITKLGFQAIVLVGGFGSSEYLLRRLQKENPTVTVLQPPNAGAVHRGLEGNQIECRVARRHYGIEFSTEYIASIHDAQDKYWDELEEKFKVNRMRWYIQKSSTIREDEPIKMGFYRTVRVRDAKESLTTCVNLYICNDTYAPKAKNNRILKLCDLYSDLSQIPRRLFERKRNSQRVEYFKISYKLVMTPTSASLLFELEFEGVSYGCVRSKY
ncbi:actin-like ATPase domain-containing protein [Aspergillus parasiticus]|uniref:Actin-like ATPase domain-containing protein n=1 Tax=Aspergillus parasiticus TaxID=5067 RepID=A0A5N6DNF1_ASPPA|nr:actin-like ATPase domain-containing protein [Aspergillus parasiticus]